VNCGLPTANCKLPDENGKLQTENCIVCKLATKFPLRRRCGVLLFYSELKTDKHAKCVSLISFYIISFRFISFAFAYFLTRSLGTEKNQLLLIHILDMQT